MLVWNEMPSITPTISCTRCELAWRSCIEATADWIALPAGLACLRLRRKASRREIFETRRSLAHGHMTCVMFDPSS
jgi:hypothetical protein